MDSRLAQRLKAIEAYDGGASLRQISRGIEKESLRILPSGQLSQQPHPKALGAALTNPNITTDYSEALLEFITPPCSTIEQALNWLKDLHHFTYNNINDELLWVNSMPCLMGDELSIPIAQYGSSNIGTMKYVYRLGLWHRYGRVMQTIAGIHYNLSFSTDFWQSYQQLENNDDDLQTFTSAGYFDVVRNFQRYSWLLIYLFGASPAICRSFLQGRESDLSTHMKNTLYLPNGTSLRMSDIGYQNSAQEDLSISYNNLSDYAAGLRQAIETPYQPYEEMGIKQDGEYLQLNSNILQIENEYYGNIRPKRNTQPLESPTQALTRRGVEYIEVRCLDIDPFDPIGIDQNKAAFVELFATFCLLYSSPLLDESSDKQIQQNMESVIYRGRDTDQLMFEQGETHSIKDLGLNLLSMMEPIAELLDNGGGNTYQTALSHAQRLMEYPAETPSARILQTLHDKQQPFFPWAMEKAQEHKAALSQHRYQQINAQQLTKIAQESLVKQQAIEANDTLSFDDFLADYFINANKV